MLPRGRIGELPGQCPGVRGGRRGIVRARRRGRPRPSTCPGGVRRAGIGGRPLRRGRRVLRRRQAAFMARTPREQAGTGEAGTVSGDGEHGDLAGRWMGRAPVPASLLTSCRCRDGGRRAKREPRRPAREGLGIHRCMKMAGPPRGRDAWSGHEAGGPRESPPRGLGLSNEGSGKRKPARRYPCGLYTFCLTSPAKWDAFSP